MIKFGDFVKFKNSSDENFYEVISDVYYLCCAKFVDLEGYDGEVNVDFIEKVEL